MFDVVSVARHWKYRPIGRPVATGDVPPTATQAGDPLPLANDVFDALTWNVMPVEAGSVVSQASKS